MRGDKKVESTLAVGERSLEAEKQSTEGVLSQGVRDSNDFNRLMLAVMLDVTSGDMSVGVGNVVCKAGSNIMKNTELRLKYAGRAKQPRAISFVS